MGFIKAIKCHYQMVGGERIWARFIKRQKVVVTQGHLFNIIASSSTLYISMLWRQILNVLTTKKANLLESECHIA